MTAFRTAMAIAVFQIPLLSGAVPSSAAGFAERVDQPAAIIQPRAVAPPACVGDCNGDGAVTVGEILIMIAIGLGDTGVLPCLAGDANGDGQVTIDEILAAVDTALQGCPVGIPNPLFVRAAVGRDTNSGADANHALASITKAAQLAGSGHRIIVGPGTYGGGITSVHSGVARQGLQFIADDTGVQTNDAPGDVIIDGAAKVQGFNLSNTPGTVIDGFHVTNTVDAGIVIKSGSDNLQIKNNVLYANAGDGIRVQDSANVLVFDNLLYGNGGVGISIVGQASGSPRATVLNNTVYSSGSRGLLFGTTAAASPAGFVRNNIISGNGSDASIKTVTSPRSDLEYDGDFNLVVPSTYIPTNIAGAHDLSVDPQFVDPVHGDFHLEASSPAIDAGDTLNNLQALSTFLHSRATAIDGHCDGGALDLGYHYRAPSCP